MPTESLYEQAQEVHKGVPLGCFSVHGVRVMPGPTPLDRNTLTASTGNTRSGYADIYAQPDCMPTESLYEQAQEVHKGVPLGCFSVHGVRVMSSTHCMQKSDASYIVKHVPHEHVSVPLGMFSVHGVRMCGQTSQTLLRSKSWKDMSMESVVDGALCFGPAEPASVEA